MKDYLLLSFNNLRRRKLRSWLTMLGIFIGIAAVVALISLGQGLEAAITSEFESFGVDKITIEERGIQGPPGSGTSQETKLTSKDLDIIKRFNGIKGAAGLIFKTAKVEYQDEIDFVFAYGIPQDSDEKRIVSFFDVEQGRDLKKDDRRKVVVGIRYTEGQVFEKKLRLGDKINIEGEDFEIVGVLERIGNPFDDSAVILPKDVLKELYGVEDEESIIYAQVENVDEIDKIKEDVEHELRKARNEEEGKETFQVRTSSQILESF